MSRLVGRISRPQGVRGTAAVPFLKWHSSLCLFALMIAAVGATHAADDKGDAVTAKDMQNYKQFMPGTDVDFDMIAIPGGEFTMGSAKTQPGHKPDEEPPHRVRVDPFWMGKREVT